MKSTVIKELVTEIVDSLPNSILKNALNDLENSNGFKISKLQFASLVVLKHENGLSMKNLSLKLGIIKQQLTKLIFSLEQESLVKRKKNAKNKREVNVFITQKGLIVFEEVLENAFNSLSLHFANDDEGKIKLLLYHLREINKLLREDKEKESND